MTNSSATLPIFNISDDTRDFLAKARAAAAEEHVSLPKYLAGMLRHAIRGHDLSKVHFYQDGTGDTYYEPVLEEALRQAAGEEVKEFDTAEEAIRYCGENDFDGTIGFTSSQEASRYLKLLLK
jgi:hypothetical protein